MGRSSIKYVEDMYGQAKTRTVSAPVSNPVIYGRFPKIIEEKSYSDKLNKILSFTMVILAVLCLFSYYFVSNGEKNMNALGREIVALTAENIELQNKIDNMHSFNKVDSIIDGSLLLDTAKKVIEIPAAGFISVPKPQSAPVNYSWFIGY